MPTQLETLSNKFNSLLNDYKNTYNEYLGVLYRKDTSFTKVQDFSFIGQSNLSTLEKSNITACEFACSDNKLCSGATFNSNLRNCVLSSGQGSMAPLNNSIAIVKKALYYSNRLKELNEELTSVNQQMLDLSKEEDYKKREIEDYKKSLEKNKEIDKMTDLLKQDYDKYTKLSEQNKKKDEIMVNNKDVLMSDRDEIERMRRQYQTLNAAYEDGNIMVNANYLNYIVLLFVVVFLVFLLMKYAFTGPQYGGGNKLFRNVPNLLIPITFVIFFVIILVNAQRSYFE